MCLSSTRGGDYARSATSCRAIGAGNALKQAFHMPMRGHYDILGHHRHMHCIKVRCGTSCGQLLQVTAQPLTYQVKLDLRPHHGACVSCVLRTRCCIWQVHATRVFVRTQEWICHFQCDTVLRPPSHLTPCYHYMHSTYTYQGTLLYLPVMQSTRGKASAGLLLHIMMCMHSPLPSGPSHHEVAGTDNMGVVRSIR